MKRLHYNAPVILTFFLLCLGALLLGALSRGWTTLHLFSVYRAPLSPLFLVRLLGHVLGHADWDHFLGNMLLLLVAGPHMEEKYGSRALLLGIGLTALISGACSSPERFCWAPAASCSCSSCSPLWRACAPAPSPSPWS